MPPRREDVLSLSQVLGLTTLHSAALATSHVSDHIFYAAGCVVVRYSPADNEQKAFYASSGKAVSSLAISQDGRYLAIGERGHLPSIVIWDLVKQIQIAALTGHKHGIAGLAFSPNGKYLVSAGFKPDKQLILWDWDQERKLTTQRLGNKVYSIQFHPHGDYFITAGDRHLKWWYLAEVPDFDAVGLEGKPASIIEDMKTSVFQDIAFGSVSLEEKVYCITSTGMLCMFNEERIVEKWIQLDATAAYTLEIDSAADLLYVGCSHGIIRCYDMKTLEVRGTLPYPVPLYEESNGVESVRAAEYCTGWSGFITAQYAACYALRRIKQPHDNQAKISAIYADRSLIVWDVSDLESVSTYRSFTGHRSCVWDIQFTEQPNLSSAADTMSSSSSAASSNVLPIGTFATCSLDNSVRIWNLDTKARRSCKFKSRYSRELLHVIHFDAEDEHEDHSAIHDSKSIIASTATGLSITNAKGCTEFDFACGMPDLEVPDRSQSPTAPRVLAVHPFGHQLAIGDKSGKLRVYDLRTMKCVFSIQAHASEILTLSFSPPLVSYDDGKNWCLQSDIMEGGEGEVEGEVSKPLVLLATAGRDRLIHIFDASTQEEHYSPIDTLDHHSSAVTNVKFTSDGKRLISCGGDKNMIFNTVNGPQISKFKEIPTPQGTINGIAIEASNKFIVTSGQDKRLNIWNIHSGKFMRAHKNAEINTELYKTDLDPSGSYITTCSFDKHITMLDFFSGEVLCQVSGHSELITSMKFSPDGRHVISVGGEGCVMIWKVSEYVVKAMRDRLVELYTNAQRRNARAASRQQSLTSTMNTQMSQSSSSSIPTVASAASSSSTNTNNMAPAASLINLKQRLSRNNQPSHDATNTSSTTMSSSTDGIPRKNRWQSNLDKDSGYELFGKKVVPDASANRNKFTLELTSAPLINEKTLIPNRNQVVTSTTQEEELVLPTTEESAAVLDGISQAVVDAENADEVMQGMSSDEEDDGSYLFPKKDDHEYDSDFEPATSNAIEDVETRASKKIDSLEKSASDLESWLEEMLRNETMLDNPSIEKAVETNNTKLGNPVLNQSLSSAFFRGVRSSTAKPTVAAVGPKDTGDDLLPPAPILGQAVSSEEADALINERKLRESAATMAQMRERIRVMEIRESDSAASTPHDQTTTNLSDKSVTHSVPIPIENTEMFMPPPPPSKEQEQQHDEDERSLFKTPSSASDDDKDHEDSIRLSTATSLRGSVNGLEELKEKTKEYKKVLSDLEKAKQKASESFQELLSLRSSLSTSTYMNDVSVAASSAVMMESMRETDLLLEQFRRSLAFQQPPPVSSTMHATTTESTMMMSSTNDLNAFLDRFSDKIADMVGEKVLSRMSATSK